MASQIDQEALAKAAVRSLAVHLPWDDRRSQDLEDTGIIHATGLYVVALVRAMRPNENKQTAYLDWGEVAGRFRVKR